MEQIQELISFLQILIALGGAARGVYCAILIAPKDEEAESYKKRLKNLLIFLVLSETVGELIKTVIGYF